MSDYSEHLISMAGGDGETVDQVHALFERIAFPETPEERDAAESKILALVREQAATIERVRAAKADALDEAAGVIESRAVNLAGFWLGKEMPELAKGSWSAMRHEARTIRTRAAELRLP